MLHVLEKPNEKPLRLYIPENLQHDRTHVICDEKVEYVEEACHRATSDKNETRAE